MLKRISHWLFGPAKDPQDPTVYKHLTLIAFFAWVGLGADGLSSSCYGPEEAFLALEDHTHLVLPLAILVAITIATISASYTQVVELFPTGGGGYLVASRLLGAPAGLVSGSALLVDYVLTIAISCASGVDAIYSFLPLEWHDHKFWAVVGTLLFLIAINLRGVKESITILLPIFMLFIVTHLVAVVAIFVKGGPHLAPYASESLQRIQTDVGAIGFLAVGATFLRAYALGGGTFTGIEAVSNAVQILREPKVQTARRTMMYMAVSLIIAAVGILVGYQLLGVAPQDGRTMNAGLLHAVGFGPWFVTTALVAEGLLLFVAAQAGFVGGPRTLATMAVDGWMPRTFSRLSDRLVTQNGVVLMGGAALIFVWVTRGSVKQLIVLYSIGVFVTFVLTHLGLVRYGVQQRRWGTFALNVFALLLTASLLGATIYYRHGGWITPAVIGGVVVAAWLIKSHYNRVGRLLKRLDQQLLEGLPKSDSPPLEAPTPSGSTAVLLITNWSGIGVHSFLSIHRLFPNTFKNFVFVSVGVVDFDRFKGADAVDALEKKTLEDLDRYVQLARQNGFYATARHAVGTDAIEELESLTERVMKEFPAATVFGGQLVFPEEGLMMRILHQQSTFALQRRLHLKGIPMMILPVRVVRTQFAR